MIAFHPLANLFPLIEGEAFKELVADIYAHGLRERLVLLDGMILDGRNRYRAMIELGMAGEWMKLGDLVAAGIGYHHFDPATQGDPLAYVLSLNLHRRHLTESQRAIIAADLGKLRQGRPSEWNKPENRDDKAGKSKPASLRDSAMTAQQRGEVLGISERQVQTGDFVKAHAAPEVVEAVRRGEVKVSAAAELARLPVEDQIDILRSADARAVARVARERVGNGGRATQASRHEPDASLDFFPTPPWAVRALIEDVLKLDRGTMANLTVWEPAVGEGHISGVLEEYFGTVIGTDIFDYSANGRSAPGWRAGRVDFLDLGDSTADDLADGADVDWIITNSPFSGESDRALGFALRSLKLAKRGVAMFVRTQWLEGIGRYQQLFSQQPPTVIAQFAERVSLFRGVWDPNGSKPDQYCWIVWIKDELGGCAFEWIAPGRCVERAREGDVERFTAHPVLATPTHLRVAPQGAAAAGEGGSGTGVALPARRLSKDEVLPILEARWATTPAEVLSAETGVPVSTLGVWAFRAGLSRHERLRETGKTKIETINARRSQETGAGGAQHD